MYSLGTVGTRKPVRYTEYQGVRIWESCKVLHIMETQSGPHILSDLTRWRMSVKRGSTVYASTNAAPYCTVESHTREQLTTTMAIQFYKKNYALTLKCSVTKHTHNIVVPTYTCTNFYSSYRNLMVRLDDWNR